MDIQVMENEIDEEIENMVNEDLVQKEDSGTEKESNINSADSTNNSETAEANEEIEITEQPEPAPQLLTLELGDSGDQMLNQLGMLNTSCNIMIILILFFGCLNLFKSISYKMRAKKE